jgi:hypothetical protein
MIRFWRKRHLLRLPVPLTGAASLGSEQSWGDDLWVPAFLAAIEREAADALDMLYALERAWFSARSVTAKSRKNSHDSRAVDVLAAAPMLSATTLASVLGITVKNAIRILDTLVAADVAIEVAHRTKLRFEMPCGHPIVRIKTVVVAALVSMLSWKFWMRICLPCHPLRRSNGQLSTIRRSKRRWPTLMR